MQLVAYAIMLQDAVAAHMKTVLTLATTGITGFKYSVTTATRTIGSAM
jgi:hypothetical protein